MRLLCGLVLIVAFSAAPCDAANLCVKTGGNDNTAKASINYVAGNEAASTCWQTIGRAAWGQATRTTTANNNGLVAGDTVYVFGGTYASNTDNCSHTVGTCRRDVYYNPVNSGSANNYITFTCVGTCDIYLQEWNGPAIGSNEKSYIKWYADVSLGYKWRMQAYGSLDDNASATQVDITADTGPVICFGSGSAHCWLEGLDIDGGPVVDYDPVGDNFTGIRIEFCNDCVVRNNKIRNVNTVSGAHGYAINTYFSARTLIEHNDIGGSDVCYSVKDNGLSSDLSSATFRFNLCDDAERCFLFSLTTNDFTDIYQNVCSNSMFGLYVTGAPANAVDVVNNTFYNVSYIHYWTTLAYTSSRFYNNVSMTSLYVHFNDSGQAYPSLDLEHNDTGGIATNYYNAAGGSQDFATFNAGHAGNNADDPDSVTDNPRIANAGSADYRLCTAVGLPNAGCVGPSPALNLGIDVLDLDGDSNTTETINAGAYITGSEHIGLDTTVTVISSGPLLPQYSRKLKKVL